MLDYIEKLNELDTEGVEPHVPYISGDTMYSVRMW